MNIHILLNDMITWKKRKTFGPILVILIDALWSFVLRFISHSKLIGWPLMESEYEGYTKTTESAGKDHISVCIWVLIKQEMIGGLVLYSIKLSTLL